MSDSAQDCERPDSVQPDMIRERRGLELTRDTVQQSLGWHSTVVDAGQGDDQRGHVPGVHAGALVPGDDGVH